MCTHSPHSTAHAAHAHTTYTKRPHNPPPTHLPRVVVAAVVDKHVLVGLGAEDVPFFILSVFGVFWGCGRVLSE